MGKPHWSHEQTLNPKREVAGLLLDGHTNAFKDGTSDGRQTGQGIRV